MRKAIFLLAISGPAVVAGAILLGTKTHPFPAPIAPGKFEPERGCLLGAYVEGDRKIGASIEKFEALAGKKHASYFRYAGYGKPFPAKWVNKVKAAGAIPNIALEPNQGLAEVKDDDYLRGWAREAKQAGCPIFLRFASEMNGKWTAYHKDPRLYVEKFRLVYRVMKQEAPNVALVWTVFGTPASNIVRYYPGDDYVDWVGTNIYSVHHHNANLEFPGWQEDPRDFLRPVYRRYAPRKPIQVSEYGASHTCGACEQKVSDFAQEKMRLMYDGLRRQFPRVRLIYYFDLDARFMSNSRNDYSLTDDPGLLAAYRRLIADPYFLSRLELPSHEKK